MTVFEDINGKRIVYPCTSYRQKKEKQWNAGLAKLGGENFGSFSIQGPATKAAENYKTSTLGTSEYTTYECYEKDLLVITLGITLVLSLILNVAIVIICRQKKRKTTEHVYSGMTIRRPTPDMEHPRPSMSDVYAELNQCSPERSPKPGNNYIDTRMVNSPVYDTAINEYFEIGKMNRESVTSPKNEYLELFPFFAEPIQESCEEPKH